MALDPRIRRSGPGCKLGGKKLGPVPQPFISQLQLPSGSEVQSQKKALCPIHASVTLHSYLVLQIGQRACDGMENFFQNLSMLRTAPLEKLTS